MSIDIDVLKSLVGKQNSAPVVPIKELFNDVSSRLKIKFQHDKLNSLLEEHRNVLGELHHKLRYIVEDKEELGGFYWAYKGPKRVFECHRKDIAVVEYLDLVFKHMWVLKDYESRQYLEMFKYHLLDKVEPSKKMQ
jgi:hypothetical protein